ncbi:discoidin domain-containing protein, partial [Clostridium sp. 19966]|uniref:discoidin domain-containing protein n=1 Tax=Clostridium sp. 19966 TaxID=2768166 RepID=UPI0028DE54D2
TVEKNSSSVQYSNIYTDTDLRYDLIGDKVKENIVINKPQENVSYSFNLNAKNLIPQLQKDNSIIFYDDKDSKKAVFQMQAPNMYDAKESQSDAVKVSLDKTKNGYSLTVTPDSDWLNSSDRVYPVTIDPPVETNIDRAKIQDTFVSSIDTENKANNILLYAGFYNNLGIHRSYVKFELPQLGPSDMVIHAQLSLACDSLYNGGGQVNVHKVLSDWNTTNITWANQPGYNSRIEDYNTPVAGQWSDFDITSIAKEWYNSGNNFGLMLKADNENSGDAAFRSADTTDANARPRAYIDYVSNTGLENYWTYHSQDVGRAGEGYVNDYNGNLVFVHDDVSMTGNRIPISIKHIYNSNEALSNSNIGYGAGWKLNLNQTISTQTFEDGTYYVYMDEDGTRHYFKQDSSTNVYKDNSGLDLTLTKNSDGTFTIKDKKDNMLIFNSAMYLQYITDNNGNKQTLVYNGTQLKSVIDPSNRKVNLDYDSQGQLTTITSPDGSKINYEYNDGMLTSITYADGKKSFYGYYNNKCLASALNNDGNEIVYNYSGGLVPRVSKVLENSINGLMGSESNIKYGDNSTDIAGIPAVFNKNNSASGVNILDVNSPDNKGTVRAIRLNAGANTPVIYSDNLKLKSNTTYTVDFDYWSDTDNNIFNVDFYPDDLPEKLFTATKTLQHASWEVSSASTNMNNACFRVFNNKTIPNASNIYVANLKISEKGNFNNIDPNASITKGNADIIDAYVGRISNNLKTIRLNSGSTIPAIYLKRFSLKQDTDYVIEFDYWSDADNVTFDADLYPDDLPQIYPIAMKAQQHYVWNIRSSSANMNQAILRFFNDHSIPNPANIYISNIKLYEASSSNTKATIRQGIQDKIDTYQFNNLGNTIDIKDEEGNSQYYKFFNNDNSDSEDASKKNKLQLESKLQKTTINLLSDHNLEVNRDWAAYSGPNGGDGSCVFSNEDSYMGNYSFKIVKNQATNNNSICNFTQNISLDKGKTYTLSAYIKTKDISNTVNKGAGAYISYQDSDGQWKKAYSSFISGTNDWQRVELKFTMPQNAASNTVSAGVGIIDEAGTAYIDCIQLEEGSVANRYNIVENSDFQYGGDVPDFWSRSGAANSNDKAINYNDATYPVGMNNRCFQIAGGNTLDKQLSQNVGVKGNQGDILVFSGWGKGDSVPLSSGRYFGLEIDINKNDNTVQKLQIPFNEDTANWQYISDVVKTDGAYKSVTVKALYTNNCNMAYFDNIQVYKEEFGSSYSYDSKGNLVSIQAVANQNSQNEFNSNNDLVKAVDPKGNQFTYNYDSNHNILSAASAENVVYNFKYDSNGNPLSATIGDNTLSLTSTSTYTSSGNYTNSVTDAAGNSVKYNWDENRGVLNSVTDSKGNTTQYEYDSMNELTRASANVGNTTVENKYSYSNDRINSITHNGFNYNFSYDGLGNNTSVAVGNQNLINNNYESRTGRLLDSTYGNGAKVSNNYDEQGRLQSKAYQESGDSSSKIGFKYVYDANGNVGFKEDLLNGVNFRYVFDIANRLNQIIASNGFKTTYKFDSNNNVSSFIEQYGDKTYTTSHTVDRDNRETATNINDGSTIKYAYDKLGRLTGKTINTSATASNIPTKVYTVTGNSSDVTSGDIGSDNISARYVKLNITKGTQTGAADNFARIRELEIYTDFEGVSNKTVTASSYNSEAGNPKNAIDGLTTTKWYDTTAAPHWLTIDLGAPVEIHNWTVKHAGSGGESTSYNTRDFKLQVSNDNINFTDADTVTGNTDSITNRNVQTIGRYVRLYITTATQPGCQDNFARIYEFSVNGYKDIAYNKSVIANSYNSPAESPYNIVDGLTNSHWCSTAATAPQWAIVDLGQAYNIRKYVLRNEATGGQPAYYNTSDFSLEFSSNSFNINYEYNNNNKLAAINLPDNESISYSYDANGNIVSIVQNGKTISYSYNELNELIREDNGVLNKSITYSYDAGGNIQTKTEYAYTTGSLGTATATHSYTYGNSNWKDELTAYDGNAITYDAIGNPLTYAGYSYSWEQGRQLSGITGNGLTASYKYDDSGIRTQKTVNGVTTNYHLVGSDVTYEDNGTDKIYYTYDSAGKLVSMNLNGVEYYYVRNGQSDIIGLFDKTGAQVVSYTYDTWGKLVSIDGSLKDTVGVKNPYRYRGYRYDTETGLYYLQSRYYNPDWGRFINADAIVGQTGDLLSTNMFAYCENTPSNGYDADGFRMVMDPDSTVGVYNYNNWSRQQEIIEAAQQNISYAKTNYGEYDLDMGYTGRIDRPHVENDQDHVHILKKKNEVSNQNADGTQHHENKCKPGEPPRSVKKTLKKKSGWDWDANEAKQNTAKVVVGVGGGYLIYRGVRMLPSLLPPFWWTIPANAVAP